MLSFEICQKYRLKPEPLTENETHGMEMLYRQWQMKWNDEYDKLRVKYPGDKMEFDVTGEDWLSDLRSWEYYANLNYQPSMPAVGVALSVLTLVSVSLLARTWG